MRILVVPTARSHAADNPETDTLQAPRQQTVVRLVLVSAGILFLEFAQEPANTRFWIAVFDAGHALLFGAIVLLLKGLPFARDSKRAFSLAMVLAIGSEVLQLGNPVRDPSVGDVLRDCAGAAAALLFEASRRRERAASIPASVAALGLCVLASAPLLLACSVYVERNRALPVLFPLDGSWWERRLISTDDASLDIEPLSKDRRVSGARACLTLRPGLYPGVFFDEPYPDWSRFHTLALTMVSEADEPLVLTIRVHDALHNQAFDDRFNRRIIVTPGDNDIVIDLQDVRRAPATRQMDLHRIRGIGLYVQQLDRPARLYLGPVLLK